MEQMDIAGGILAEQGTRVLQTLTDILLMILSFFRYWTCQYG